MKMFSVHLEVSLNEIGDAEEIDKPRSTPIADSIAPDSPVKDVAKVFDLMQERGIFTAASPVQVFPGMRGPGDSMSMHHSFKVIVGSFEEMQQVLSKFRAVADSFTLPAG